MAFTLSSSAFNPGDRIPDKHTTSGQNVSPPLAWSDPPSGTQAFVIILEDINATGGAYVHWVVFNIPASETSLPEALPRGERLPNGAIQGRIGVGGNGYQGPSMSPGVPAHNYRFTLYALDAPLSLGPEATGQQVRQAMEGHVLGEAGLMGQFWNRRAQMRCD